MIVADTNVWIGFFNQTLAQNTLLFREAIQNQAVAMPTPILHELLCFPELNDLDRIYFSRFQTFNPSEQTWLRAGEMRRKILHKKLKCRAIDALIAQTCIENGLPLLTLDNDFKKFSNFGLKLLKWKNSIVFLLTQ